MSRMRHLLKPGRYLLAEGTVPPSDEGTVPTRWWRAGAGDCPQYIRGSVPMVRGWWRGDCPRLVEIGSLIVG